MAYPSDLKYTKDHEWVELSGDRGKVGITDYAQQQLGDVVYVELPEVGARLKQGTSFGTVEVNTALKDKPEALNADPHTSWMIILKIADPAEATGLLDATQYADLVK